MTGGITRRQFLAAAGGACLGWPACRSALALGGGSPAASQPAWKREVDHYVQLPERRIQCFVCPLNCVLEDGQTCFCRTRTNVGGRLFTRAYNNPCIVQLDPIEKLPLYHFLPGSQTLTIGVGGCNVRCLYCQNFEQSQKLPDEQPHVDLTPQEAIAYARRKKIGTIAFSYTEPVAFMEYAQDIAMAARKSHLRVVVATAAFVNPDPLVEFARYVDAFVVSLKGFDEEFYHRVCGIRLAPVLAAIEALRRRTRCWLELLNLVVPSYNDDPEKIRQMCVWVRDHVGPDVPLHFARFVPMYRLNNLPRTPVPTLERAWQIGRDAGLRYVYITNLSPHQGNDTYCAACGEALVRRLGLRVLENRLEGARCPGCGQPLPGVWA